jgi:hypothetical protein
MQIVGPVCVARALLPATLTTSKMNQSFPSIGGLSGE